MWVDICTSRDGKNFRGRWDGDKLCGEGGNEDKLCGEDGMGIGDKLCGKGGDEDKLCEKGGDGDAAL